MRTLLVVVVTIVSTTLLTRWLSRRFPVGPKPHDIEWYRPRYTWIEWTGGGLSLAGLLVGVWLYKAGHVPSNDPRGFAVGFALACVLPVTLLLLVCAFSPHHRLREYWDFHELEHGVRNVFALYIVLPVFVISLYGAIHWLVRG